MNTDIRLSTSFKGHRKLKKLERRIGEGAAKHLIGLWITVAEDRPEGVLSGWDTEDIALAADWPGDVAELVSALKDCGWLDVSNDGVFIVHDWCEHQGWACAAQTRTDKARINALIRHHGREKALKMAVEQYGIDVTEHGFSPPNFADSMPAACKTHAKSNAPSPSPSPKDNNAASGDAVYTTRKKRKLKGSILESFLKFWDAFNYKQGKAEAADAWLDIPPMKNGDLENILTAARLEAKRRPGLIKQGQTPKMAQGWLSGRRWEDEIKPMSGHCATPDWH